MGGDGAQDSYSGERHRVARLGPWCDEILDKWYGSDRFCNVGLFTCTILICGRR